MNIPAENMKGWLNSMKRFGSKIDTLEEIPELKIDILNDEFGLSEILSKDRLTLLSFILKIEERVIQQFFDSKRDCKRTLRARPTATLPSKRSLNAAAFGRFLVPCLRLTRCSVPPEKPAYCSNQKRTLTSDQLAILKDIFSRQEFPDRDEINRIAEQFGPPVTSTHIGKWFYKNRYRKKMLGQFSSSPVKIEPRLTRFQEKEAAKSSPEIIDLEKLEALDTIVKTEPRSNNQHEKPGPKAVAVGVMAVAVQNALFEEYKKSPILTARRKNILQKSLKIHPSRMQSFFNTLSALLRGKTENDITKLLTPYPRVFLSKIAAEHRRNRYISVMKSQKLAKQLGTSRRIVIEWFSNARLYELLSGNRFHPIVKPLAQPALVCENPRENASDSKTKQLVPANPDAPEKVSDGSDSAANGIPDDLPDSSKQLLDNSSRLERDSDKFNGHTVSSQKKVIPYNNTVREILFNAFKQSSVPSSSSLKRICSATKLSTGQVGLWFQRMRRNLITIGTEQFLFQSDCRNLNLSQEQIMTLEEEFQKHPYENESIREQLADQLEINKRTIQTWFYNRRHYDLIVFGMPELMEGKRTGASNESAEDKKNEDCPDFSSNTQDMVISNSIAATRDFEVRLFPLKDIPLNDSSQSFHPSMNNGGSLVDVTVIKEEPLFEEPDAPSKMEISLADVDLTGKGDIICPTDSTFPEHSNGSLQLSEKLECVAENFESFVDDVDDDGLSQYPSAENGSTAVSLPDVCGVSELSSLHTPCAEERHHMGVESAIISPIKNCSTEKTVAICEAAIAFLENISVGKLPSQVSKPLVNNSEVDKTLTAALPELPEDSVLPAVSKSLVDHFSVCETATVTPKELIDGFNLLSDTSLPLPTAVNVCSEVAAAPKALANAFESPFNNSKPVVDHSHISRMATDVPDEALDGSESLIDSSDSTAYVSMLPIDNLDVSEVVISTSEELQNNLEPSPDIFQHCADDLGVCNSVAALPEKLPDDSKPLFDTSMPLVSHLDVYNGVDAVSEEFPNGLKLEPDIFEPHADPLEMSDSVVAASGNPLDSIELLPDISMPLADFEVSNSVAASPVELPDSLDPLADDSMSLDDNSIAYNNVDAAPGELPNSSEPLPGIFIPMVHHSEVSSCVAVIPEELPESLKQFPDISTPLADHLEVSNSAAATLKKLPNSLEPHPDNSKSSIDHLEAPNAVADSHNELPNGTDSAPDVPKPLVNHVPVLTNGLRSPIGKKPLYLSTALPLSPRNTTEQLPPRFGEPHATPMLMSSYQHKTLLRAYKQSRFVSPPKARMLASDLNLPLTSVKMWFQQRRFKDWAWVASTQLADEKFKLPQSSQSLSPFQLFVLEQEFGKNCILTTDRLTYLCQKLKINRTPIIAWFQERHRVEAAKT